MTKEKIKEYIERFEEQINPQAHYIKVVNLKVSGGIAHCDVIVYEDYDNKQTRYNDLEYNLAEMKG